MTNHDPSGGSSTYSAGTAQPRALPTVTEKPNPFFSIFRPSIKAAWEQAEKLNEQKREDLREYYDLLGKRIREMSAYRASITVIQPKGGVGKTPVICNTATMLRQCGDRSIVLIDHNENYGTTAMQLGLADADEMTVREAAALAKEGKLSDSSVFTGKLPISEGGVPVLASDPVTQQGDYYTDETSALNIKTAASHVQFVVNDTGNSLQGSAMHGVLMNTKVLIVPTTVDDSCARITRSAFGNLERWGYGDLARFSVTVIVGIKPGDTIEEHREALGRNASHVLLAIPYEQRAQDKQPTNFSETDPYVLLAYREIVLASLLSARAADGKERFVQELEQIRSGSLVSLPSGRKPALPWVDGSARLDWK